jgi:hypothetical protein
MKRRRGYVSNSSSSSFVILNWSELDNEKKGMVLNYGDHVLEVWKQNGLPIKKEHNDFHIDFDSLPKSELSSEYVESHSVEEIAQWFREHGNDESDGLVERLDFGWVDDYWRFREKDGRLEMTTSMDNFDMEKWMDYVGGIEYEWTGERFGLFDDEKIEFDTSILDRIADSNSRRNMDDGDDEGAKGIHQDA